MLKTDKQTISKRIDTFLEIIFKLSMRFDSIEQEIKFDENYIESENATPELIREAKADMVGYRIVMNDLKYKISKAKGIIEYFDEMRESKEIISEYGNKKFSQIMR